GATESHQRPVCRLRRRIVDFLLIVRCDERRRVEGREIPKHGQMDDPNAVEIDEHVQPRTRLLVGLEEDLLPFHVLELEIALSRRHINQPALVLEYNALKALRIPEKLVTVVVTNDLVMIPFAADVDAIDNLVSLIPDVLVEGRDDVVEVGELLNRLYHVLAGR